MKSATSRRRRLHRCSSPGRPARSRSPATAATSPRSTARSKPSAGQTYGTLSTVNGDVRVGRGATADEAKTVNGEIDARGRRAARRRRAPSTVRSISATASPIARDASTVNGGVDTRQARARRRRRLDGLRRHRARWRRSRRPAHDHAMATSSSPTARACAAAFTSRRTTTATGAGARTSPIKVHICGTCVVDGELRFDRPVELRVDRARRSARSSATTVTRR